MSRSDIPKPLRAMVLDRDRGRCRYCNLSQAGQAAVFHVDHIHPLQQNWNEHFTIDPDGNCRGLTDVGRATAAALGMNDPLPRLARQLQLRLGLIDGV